MLFSFPCRRNVYAGIALAVLSGPSLSSASSTPPSSLLPKVVFSEDTEPPSPEQRAKALELLPQVVSALQNSAKGITAEDWCRNLQREMQVERLGFCAPSANAITNAYPFHVKNLKFKTAIITVDSDEEVATAPASYIYQLIYSYTITGKGQYPIGGTRTVAVKSATVSLILPSGTIHVGHPADIPFITMAGTG